MIKDIRGKVLSYAVYCGGLVSTNYLAPFLFATNPLFPIFGLASRVLEDIKKVDKDNIYLNAGRVGVAGLMALSTVSSLFGLVDGQNSFIRYEFLNATGDALLTWRILADADYGRNIFRKNKSKGLEKEISN